ncbi:hypothetical protein LPJ56_000700 [Coemansia sp. RSA 2599]|nr:hypothetical protein LPJ75_000381 [Coemansia sp. RSA 2598]KAJ1829009.1 hypothetical protein LPJ56_000700 [Coemansia sp. RSA 2599]
MEEFMSSLKYEEVPLTVIDTQGSFSNIPFVYFYKNTDGSNAFMPSDVLRNAYFKTLQQMPVLSGSLRPKSRGNISIVIDPENVNLPDYKESSTNVHFDDLEAEGFCWKSWPEGVNTAGPMVNANEEGVIKMANIHVIRLRDNSGLMIYVSMIHYVVDGPAHSDFVERWCLNYQHLTNEGPESSEPLPPFLTDRKLLQSPSSVSRSPLHEESEKTFTKFSILAELMAWISPEMRGHIISRTVEGQKAETHIFHISRASLDSLKKSVSEHLLDSSELVINEIVLSLALKTMAQSQQKVEARSGSLLKSLWNFFFKSSYLPIAVIFDTREQLGLADKLYTGNVLVPKIIYSDKNKMESRTTDESLAEVITYFEPLTRDLSASYVASHIDMVSSRPTSFARPMARFLFHRNAISFVYDVMPNMYKADFGHGKPTWVSPIKPFRANAVLLLTHKDPTDGIDVFMSVYPEVMKEVLQNKAWTDVAKLIY